MDMTTQRKRWLEPKRRAYQEAYRKEPKNRAREAELRKARYAADPILREKVARRGRAYRKKNLLEIKEKDRKRKGYVGAGTCPLCSKLVKSLHRDHHHVTGFQRENLCKHCNWMIGHSFESPVTLRKAADYLERFAKMYPKGQLA
jgi:Recombination endonuclease VII